MIVLDAWQGAQLANWSARETSLSVLDCGYFTA